MLAADAVFGGFDSDNLKESLKENSLQLAKAVADAHKLPTENLLAPDYVRRIAWTPPEDPSVPVIEGILAGFGARPWQIEITVSGEHVTDGFQSSTETLVFNVVPEPSAYLLGGLQIRGMRREIVDSGQRTEKDFHDEIMRQGSMPVAFLRLAHLHHGPRQHVIGSKDGVDPFVARLGVDLGEGVKRARHRRPGSEVAPHGVQRDARQDQASLAATRCSPA